MNLNPFKKVYRVLEVKKGDDSSRFYPQQQRFLFFWKGVPERYGSSTTAKYKKLEYANDFLYKLHLEERSMRTVGVEAHEFNEVFHKLKNTDTDANTSEDTEYT